MAGSRRQPAGVMQISDAGSSPMDQETVHSRSMYKEKYGSTEMCTIDSTWASASAQRESKAKERVCTERGIKELASRFGQQTKRGCAEVVRVNKDESRSAGSEQ